MNQQMEELVIDHRNYNPYKPDGEIKAPRNRPATPKKRKINKWQAFSFQNTIIIFLKKNLHVTFIIIYFYYYIIK